jgi:hypothetical protein
MDTMSTYFANKILFFFTSQVKAARPTVLFVCHDCRSQDGHQQKKDWHYLVHCVKSEEGRRDGCEQKSLHEWMNSVPDSPKNLVKQDGPAKFARTSE